MKRVFGAKMASDAATPSCSSSSAMASSLPEYIVETFRGDYNILLVHQKVIEHFRKQQDLLPLKRKHLAQLQWIQSNGNTVVERRRAMLEISSLQGWITATERKEDELRYQQVSGPLLEEYQRLIVNRKARVFGEKRAVDEHGEARELLIVKYLALARRYIDIHVVLDTSTEPTCPICEAPLAEGVGLCKNCPAFVANFETDNNYKDSESSKIPSRNNYGKQGHIYEAFIKFQGKQPNNLPAGLLEDVDSTRIAFGISKETFTIDMLYQILRDKKYSSHYDDIYLIYHLITGKKLPDLDDIMPELKKDADDFAAIYPEVKPKTRLNCLNAHFIRDVLLRRKGREYPEWQCTYLRTEMVDHEHNACMLLAFQKMNWGPYKPL